MGPRQRDVRRHRTDRDRLVLDIGNAVVRRPVVRHEPGVGGHGAEHESVDVVLAEALDHLQPGASRRAAVDFDRAGDQHFADATAPRRHDDGVALGTEGKDRLVGLDHAAQRLALRVDHRPAQLGAQHPGGTVGAQAELALELQCRDAVGVRRHQKRGPEPGGQRQLAGVHDGPCRHRGLPPAGGTLVGESLGLQKPGAAIAAARAYKPFRPTALKQVGRASAFARKATLKLDQRLWKPNLGPRHGSPVDHRQVRSLPHVPVLYTTFSQTGGSCISH